MGAARLWSTMRANETATARGAVGADELGHGAGVARREQREDAPYLGAHRRHEDAYGNRHDDHRKSRPAHDAPRAAICPVVRRSDRPCGRLDVVRGKIPGRVRIAVIHRMQAAFALKALDRRRACQPAGTRHASQTRGHRKGGVTAGLKLFCATRHAADARHQTPLIMRDPHPSEAWTARGRPPRRPVRPMRLKAKRAHYNAFFLPMQTDRHDGGARPENRGDPSAALGFPI